MNPAPRSVKLSKALRVRCLALSSARSVRDSAAASRSRSRAAASAMLCAVPAGYSSTDGGTDAATQMSSRVEWAVIVQRGMSLNARCDSNAK